MYDSSPQQRFWSDPSNPPEELGQLSERYLGFCKPEFYIGLWPISEYLVSIIRAYMPSGSILEPGCSVGRNLQAFHDAGYSAIGLEVNPKVIEIANVLFPDAKIMVGTAEALIQYIPDREFDVVITQGFLMHIPHEELFPEMKRVARKYIVTNEVENPPVSTVKFTHDYNLEDEEWKQVAILSQINVPAITTSTTRVFKRDPSGIKS